MDNVGSRHTLLALDLAVEEEGRAYACGLGNAEDGLKWVSESAQAGINHIHGSR